MIHIERGFRGIKLIPSGTSRDWDENIVPENDFKKPLRRKMAKPESSPYLRDNRIVCTSKVIDNYKDGNLGIILKFNEIKFITGAPIKRSKRDYGPNTAAFSSRIIYEKGLAHLVLATKGDIFECQIVPARIDVDLLFQEELYLPKLSVTHDPTSMTVLRKNNIVTVVYSLLVR